VSYLTSEESNTKNVSYSIILNSIDKYLIGKRLSSLENWYLVKKMLADLVECLLNVNEIESSKKG
jgi:hypothetical protein